MGDGSSLTSSWSWYKKSLSASPSPEERDLFWNDLGEYIFAHFWLPFCANCDIIVLKVIKAKLVKLAQSFLFLRLFWKLSLKNWKNFLECIFRVPFCANCDITTSPHCDITTLGRVTFTLQSYPLFNPNQSINLLHPLHHHHLQPLLFRSSES